MDSDIAQLVEEQVTSNAESVQRIQAAKADLSELFKKIDDVRERASQTERAITEMTADIKQLDNAKRNLTLSMTALKRLQMLTTAYEQLCSQAKTRQYRECAQLLQAVIQLMAHFKSYRSIDQIATLSRNVAEIQRELLEQVCEDFEITFAKGEVMQRRGVLAEACLVVDALGDHARSRIITWYCNTQLREYRQVFRGSDEAGSLDNISRRYSWFRRMMKTHDEEHANIFPSSWRVAEVLANVFCENTRDDFKGILARTVRSGQTIDVNLLLSCLQETLDFEHSLDRRFSTQSRASTDTFTSSTNEAPVFTQVISEAFEPYLGVWVDAQAKHLASLIPKYRQQPLKPDDEEFHAQLVISSSTELFTYYRHALAQCSKLSTSGSLAELSKVFAKYLDQYAQQVLLNYLSAGSNSSTKALSVEDLILVLNTADYCYTTCNQLEEKIKSRIDENHKASIDLQSQADSFMGIASATVRGLVRKVEVELEPCWREMRNSPWNKLENVGDQSSYASELLSRIKTKSEEIVSLLHKQQYSRAFADHLVEFVSNTFLSNIYLCRPISETGAEQMLLDSYTLKSGLTTVLPAPAPASYVKRVNASFGKIDTVLKTIQVRPSPPEALVQAYLIHIADRSEANFRRILELKGLRLKHEQAPLVELFHLHRASDRYASSLQQSNPVMAFLQPSQGSSASGGSSGGGSAGVHASSSMAQGLSSLSTTAAASLGGGGTSRFDASLLGSAIFSAANATTSSSSNAATSSSSPIPTTTAQNTASNGTGPSSGTATPSTTAPSGPPLAAGETSGPFDTTATTTSSTSSAAANLNENLKNLGKFFRRDLGGFGGRFGRSDDSGR